MGPKLQTIKLITLDEIEALVAVTEKEAEASTYKRLLPDGRTRVYAKDPFRDGEFREVSDGEKSYKTLLRQLTNSFAEMGDKTIITLHVALPVFRKIHKEFSGKLPEKELTFIQFNTKDAPLFIRFAPEKENKMILAEDLKSLTLKELVDLKMEQDKK